MKTLKIKCKGSALVPLEELLEYQGNLKELTETNQELLRASMEEGFIQPISVWIKPSGEKFIMDGHQRVKVLKLMAEDYKIPPLPVCEVFAETEAEAAKIVLKDISQFGKVTMEGLIEFTDKYELDIEEVKLAYNFPELNLEAFDYNKDYSEEVIKEKEVGEQQTKNCCPNCGYEW